MSADEHNSRSENNLQVSRGGRPRKSKAERKVSRAFSIRGKVLDKAQRMADAEGINLSTFADRALAVAVGLAA
jgi:hypothetical protein